MATIWWLQSPNVNVSYYFDTIGKTMDRLLGVYDNILILGDFNSEINDTPMKDFLDTTLKV